MKSKCFIPNLKVSFYIKEEIELLMIFIIHYYFNIDAPATCCTCCRMLLFYFYFLAGGRPFSYLNILLYKDSGQWRKPSYRASRG